MPKPVRASLSKRTVAQDKGKCIACDGSGNNSKGNLCFPCRGTGRKLLASTVDTDLDKQIACFVDCADYALRRSNIYKYPDRVKHVIDMPNDKWVRIMTEDTFGTKTGVYSFISLIDVRTISMGFICAGDVFKALNVKQPGKVKAGNVYDQDYRQLLSPYGIIYLRT